MFSDFHLHTSHSFDSKEPVENIINKCIELGMTDCCITDHNDFNWPVKGEDFTLDVKKYFDDLVEVKEIYAGRINVRIGIECGLTKENIPANNELINNNEFDFVIGSVHIVGGMDPYYPEFHYNKTKVQVLNEYFNAIKDNIKVFDNFDVLGHMDYVIRYYPDPDKTYELNDFRDITDDILKHIIEKGKGIEINTSALKSGLDIVNPSEKLIRRYKELGGEIITIGSDAHKKEYVGLGFDYAREILKKSGFEYYCIFDKRRPFFVKL